MADNGRQSDDGQAPFLGPQTQADREHHRDEPLQGIEHEREGEGPVTPRPEHIGGADIAAAELAHVEIAVELHHEPATRNRPQ